MTDQAPGSASSADQPADGPRDPGGETPSPWSRESSAAGAHALGADDPAPADPSPQAPPPSYGPPSYGPAPGTPGSAAPQVDPQPWAQPPTAGPGQPPHAEPAPYEPAPPYGQRDQGSGYGSPEQPPYGVAPGYGVSPYPGGYGGAYPDYGTAAPDHPQATAALVTGIVALVLSPLLGLGGLVGIASVLLGAKARREIDSDPARYGGRAKATAGLVLGVIAIVTLVGWILLALLVVVANTV